MAEEKTEKTKGKAKASEKQDSGLRMFVKYESAAAALEAIKSYFQWADDFHILYGEASMAQRIKVQLSVLRGWFDGKNGEDFQEVAQWAYQQIAAQFETDDQYVADKVVSKRGWSLMKQPRFQGYQEKTEEKTDVKIKVVFGDNVDKSDFM